MALFAGGARGHECEVSYEIGDLCNHLSKVRGLDPARDRALRFTRTGPMKLSRLTEALEPGRLVGSVRRSFGEQLGERTPRFRGTVPRRETDT